MGGETSWSTEISMADARKELDRLESVLALDHQWDAWKGNTPEALAAAIDIIRQGGFGVACILCSRLQYYLLHP